MSTQTLQYYLDRYTLGTMTQEEWEIFRLLLQDPKNAGQLDHFMDEQLQQATAVDISYPVINKEIVSDVLAKINAGQPVAPARPAHRVHFLMRSWFRYAAAVILIAGLGAIAYLLTTHETNEQTVATTNKSLQADITPGTDRAILTLADGRTIALDSASNGQLANQGGVGVVKLADGRIIYNVSPNAKASAEPVLNTMRTPNGGQYQVTLPDGTRVWLNASSSITFPTAFNDDKRHVKVAGEIYFEVAKDKQRPFFVDIDGQATVQVLGTSFNVNSYADEDEIKTTLVEGSVKVIKENKSAILKPGQQAVFGIAASADSKAGNISAITIRSDVDLDQALAWKNGLFNFDELDVYAVMRQLERWYDIKVRFQGSASSIIFKGKMYRNVNLSDVLDMLQRMGVRFKLEGKTLIVLGIN